MRNLFETDSNVKYESCFQLRKLPKKTTTKIIIIRISNTDR